LNTDAALLEAGVRPDDKVCYHAGVHSLEADNLESHPELDGRCKSLAYGLAKSQNAIIGRLAHDHLDPQKLEHLARAFGFGAAPPFALPVASSSMTVPTDALGFARTAAGFWNTTLSPLHGAYLAATIARGGEAPSLKLIDRILDGEGRTLPVPEAAPPHRALDEHTAHTLARMMIGTTEWGSARSAFHDATTSHRLLGRVKVAGKTGSLNAHDPFLAYSWFVGFAPADRPRIAFAVLLGRDEDDAVKAADVARALVASWLTTARAASLVAAR
jgi:cell division protein FtsI/penicillin-binding protein 2